MAKVTERTEGQPGRRYMGRHPDWGLLMAGLVLVGLGLVMVASASLHLADRQMGQPFHYVNRQALFIVLGLLVGYISWRMPLVYWHKAGMPLLLIGLFLLGLILIPGLGREVNGSVRWFPLGSFSLQVSELAKLFVVIYMAGYLARHNEDLRTGWSGFLKPIVLLILACALLLAEPDFGAASVLLATVLGMMFVGGARLGQFTALFFSTAAAGALLVLYSPYRLQRVLAFTDPWADPYNSGFQLTQALIAIGRGEWFGVGLGASVQKLFYLPEAHTDFLFAVIAEELGLVGAITVILLYAFIVWRAFRLGAAAHQRGRPFAGHLAYGLGLLIGLQAFVNLGVNMGLLPTKGLTLPLMSYGGSSMLTACLTLGLLLRVAEELPGEKVREWFERSSWIHA